MRKAELERRYQVRCARDAIATAESATELLRICTEFPEVETYVPHGGRHFDRALVEHLLRRGSSTALLLSRNRFLVGDAATTLLEWSIENIRQTLAGSIEDESHTDDAAAVLCELARKGYVHAKSQNMRALWDRIAERDSEGEWHFRELGYVGRSVSDALLDTWDLPREWLQTYATSPTCERAVRHVNADVELLRRVALNSPFWSGDTFQAIVANDEVMRDPEVRMMLVRKLRVSPLDSSTLKQFARHLREIEVRAAVRYFGRDDWKDFDVILEHVPTDALAEVGMQELTAALHDRPDRLSIVWRRLEQ
jgi:hypothetical protein